MTVKDANSRTRSRTHGTVRSGKGKGRGSPRSKKKVGGIRYPERDSTDLHYGRRITVRESADAALHYIANIRCEVQQHRDRECPCEGCREWAAGQLVPVVKRALKKG